MDLTLLVSFVALVSKMRNGFGIINIEGLKLSRTRHNWTNFFKSKGKSLEDPFAVPKTKRNARQKNALNIKRIVPFECTSQVIDGDTHYVSNNDAHLILGDSFIILKLPYGLSVNEIWRATIDERGVQRNSLSLSARNYKRNVHNIYKPLLDHIEFKKINELCEVRLIAQPPVKTKNYSAKTYPRYDIDNYPKLIIDSLKDLVFKDDNIFIHEQIQLAKPIENGCVWVSCVFMQEQSQDWLNRSVDFSWLAGR